MGWDGHGVPFPTLYPSTTKAGDKTHTKAKCWLADNKRWFSSSREGTGCGARPMVKGYNGLVGFFKGKAAHN